MVMYRVDPRQLKGRSDKLEPKREGEHVWTAIASFVVSEKELVDGNELHMDNENLASLDVGCYQCEQAYSVALARRKCKPV